MGRILAWAHRIFTRGRRIRDKFIAQDIEGVPEDVIEGLAEFALMSRLDEGEPLDTFDWSKFHVGTIDNAGLAALDERITTNATVH